MNEVLTKSINELKRVDFKEVYLTEEALMLDLKHTQQEEILYKERKARTA